MSKSRPARNYVRITFMIAPSQIEYLKQLSEERMLGERSTSLVLRQVILEHERNIHRQKAETQTNG